MTNELPKSVPPAARGGNPPAKPDAPVAGTAKPAPAAQPAVVAGAAHHSVPLFGGHRGGGKKRKDGLPAGSPEAIAADREKNAARMREARAAKKAAALPPPLPAVPATAANPNPPPAGGGTVVPVAPAGAAVTAAAPLFVGWSEKILARPAKLLIRIVDRLRCAALMRRVRRLGLNKEQEREIADDLKYKEELVNDFGNALAVSVATELNHRQVPGAQHSHWLDTAMLGGEAVLVHLNCLDKLEKLIAENAKLQAEAGKNLPPKPQGA